MGPCRIYIINSPPEKPFRELQPCIRNPSGNKRYVERMAALVSYLKSAKQPVLRDGCFLGQRLLFSGVTRF